jgi:hypothetical protein
VILAVAFAAGTLFLWSATLFFQGYIYSEPVSQLYWRAPLASLILTAYLSCWSFLDFRSPGSFNTLFDFSAREEQHFNQFWSIKKGREILFVARKTPQGRTEYRAQDTLKPWSRSDSEGVMEAIVVEDGSGEKIRFEAELTKEGRFKAAPGEPVRYVEVGGRRRVMTDEYIGKLSTFRWGMFLANVGLNLLHLGLWFICLWVLMRFQWGHAFGFALVVWLALTLTLLPMLFSKTEEAARQRVGQERAALNCVSRVSLRTECA